MIIIGIIAFQLCGDISLLHLHFFVSISVDGFCLFNKQYQSSVITAFLNHFMGNNSQVVPLECEDNGQSFLLDLGITFLCVSQRFGCVRDRTF